MSVDPRIVDAQNEVEAKRAQLMHSVKHAMGETKRRLAPDLLAGRAWAETKKATARLAEDTAAEVRAKPLLFGGIAAAVGLFLARKPIGKAAVELYDSVTGHEEEKSQALPEAPATKPPPRRRPRKDDPAPSVSEFDEATRPVALKKDTKRDAPKKPAKKKKTEKSK
ncbi:hypothetical protein [Sphingomicrobium sediminis]|uniref:DUF3618 domain-containing protein n=1 Tax=Sphingomicrobium sediminis TaxID=2950949 RepID=A0A9X2EK75_9SPHN|nr:hypothetical protein [Sphingomicrobium sediminis]MCM8556847.1 hypothetical protein [Sphingomicrobium sediminis]